MKRVTMLTIAVVSTATLGALGLGGESLLHKLTSPDESERREAADGCLVERNELIRGLVGFIEENADDKAQWGPGPTQVNTALYVLGELRQPWAVDPLIKRINAGYVPGEGVWLTEVGPNVVGEALIKIGKPSVPAVLDLLRSTEDGYIRWQCSMILSGIEGKEVGRFILRKAIERERDSQKKANLQRALPYFRRGRENLTTSQR